MALKRDQPVSVRLSAAEIAAIDELARRHGVNRSAYMREVLISVVSKPGPGRFGGGSTPGDAPARACCRQAGQ